MIKKITKIKYDKKITNKNKIKNNLIDWFYKPLIYLNTSKIKISVMIVSTAQLMLWHTGPD